MASSFLPPRPHLLQAVARSRSRPSASFPFLPALLHPDDHHHPLSSPSSFSVPWTNSIAKKRPSSVRFALAGSEQPNSLEQQESLRPLLQELADSFALPNDYFQQLPRDLRLDLNDAAFDLSQGPVIEECGQELGEMLLNLSRAWELADAATSSNIVSKLPVLESLLTDRVKSAFGRRLLSAGRRYQSMGQYGQGELQKIAKALIATGKALSASPVTATNEMPQGQSRVLKFGELQVELTPKKAYVGAVIGVVFGILSWELGQGVLSIPENSLEYANDNALLLAKCVTLSTSHVMISGKNEQNYDVLESHTLQELFALKVCETSSCWIADGNSDAQEPSCRFHVSRCITDEHLPIHELQQAIRSKAF